jgi:hypothetical protein
MEKALKEVDDQYASLSDSIPKVCCCIDFSCAFLHFFTHYLLHINCTLLQVRKNLKNPEIVAKFGSDVDRLEKAILNCSSVNVQQAADDEARFAFFLSFFH